MVRAIIRTHSAQPHGCASANAAGPSGRSHFACPVAHGRALDLQRTTTYAAAQGFGRPKMGTLKQEAVVDQQETQDKLISAFQGKPQSAWKKMIAYSKQWPALADGVFDR